jgi:hypothetical protein
MDTLPPVVSLQIPLPALAREAGLSGKTGAKEAPKPKPVKVIKPRPGAPSAIRGGRELHDAGPCYFDNPMDD